MEVVRHPPGWFRQHGRPWLLDQFDLGGGGSFQLEDCRKPWETHQFSVGALPGKRMKNHEEAH